MALITSSLDRQPVTVEVTDAGGQHRERILHLERLPAGVKEREALGAIGLVPAHAIAPAVVGEVATDGPAVGKLQAGDRILAVDGQVTRDFEALPTPITAAGEAGRAAQLLSLIHI